jgi:hypothetical protein
VTASAAKGFLTYLGLAIRLELLRPNIEAQTGDKQVAQLFILEALRKFKIERGIA